jgi:DNA-binding protein Fis
VQAVFTGGDGPIVEPDELPIQNVALDRRTQRQVALIPIAVKPIEGLDRPAIGDKVLSDDLFLTADHFLLGSLKPDLARLSGLRVSYVHQDCTLEAVEQLLISQSAEHCKGNISEAARVLGFSRGALRHAWKNWPYFFSLESPAPTFL